MSAANTETARRPATVEEFRTLRTGPRLFVLAVIAGGIGAIALDVQALRIDRPWLFAAVMVAALLTSVVKISVPLSRGGSTLSLSFAVTLAAIPLLSGTSACLIGVASAWSQCTFRMKTRNPIHRTLFSVSMVAMSSHVALQMFNWTYSPDPTYVLSVLRPVLAATTGYFLVNSMLVAAAVGLSTRQPVVRVWFDNFLWSAPAYFVAGVVAVLGVVTINTRSDIWTAVIVIPLYLTYRSYRTFVARIEEERARVQRLSEVQLATIEALALAIEAKDRTSQDHIRRIQRYAEALGRAIEMPESEIPGLKTAALLHDIGNLAVPEHILAKPGALSPEEFQRIKIHPRVGADIVQSVPFPYPVGPLILTHHEHWDGSGYPLGLHGLEIPLGARVLAVVDQFTALMAERPYRPARGLAEAKAILQEEAGKTLDPSLVEKFLALLPVLDREDAAGAAEERLRRPGCSIDPVVTGGSALDQIVTAHREVQVLYEIAEALGTSLSVDSTVTLLASKLSEVLPTSCAALFLWDAESRLFRCRRAVGIAADRVAELVIDDIWQLGTQLPRLRPAEEPQLRSVLSSALMSGDTAVGALCLYSSTGDAYGDDQRRLLDRISHQTALVIANAIVFERTHEESLTDTMTGLANRRALHQRLLEDLARAGREGGKVSVVLLDVNNLKHLNDTYGHDVGDCALRSASALLAGLRRPYDLCVRYGGDEFVMVLSDCTAAAAEARMKELQASIERATVVIGDDQFVTVSMSAGAATYPEDGTSAETLLAVADQRMYHDKMLRKASQAAAAARPAAGELPVAV